MASNFTGNSLDFSRNTSNPLSTDLKVSSDSSLNISTDSSNLFNANKYFQGSSNYPVAASVEKSANSNPPFSSGWYTVGKTGKVSFDYLFDGGAYEGELAIFSLEGMGQYQVGSNDFIKEAVRRALSNSTLGYVVISDSEEAARFSENLRWDVNHNEGEYRGLKSFAMRSGDQFAIMQLPNGKLQEVLNNIDFEGEKRPLFSLAPSNPLAASHFGKFQDVNGGRIFGMEDLREDGASDNDFNDFIFYMQGAVGDAPSLDDLIDGNRDWRPVNVGQKISAWKPTPDNQEQPPVIQPPVLPPVKPPYENGDLVKGSDEKVYQIDAGKKRWIPNPGIFREMGFKQDTIKTLSDANLSSIPPGDNLPIPTKYQESANVTNEWRSDFYWWDAKGTPSLDFSSNSNNKFATLNLGSNTRSDSKKGINFDWGAGSPKGDDKLLNDTFAIAAYTEATFEDGIYTFRASGDDGFQVFAKNIDTGKQINITPENQWTEAYNGKQPFQKEVSLNGRYELSFVFYEKDRDAKFDLTWDKKVIELPKLPHKYEFTYFFNGENKDGSDYYTGWVIENPSKYKIGEYLDFNPENNETGKNGRYYITNDVVLSTGKIGEVFVNRYYDSETKTDFTSDKFSRGELSATTGLGNEYNFIGDADDDSKFGQDKYEYDETDKQAIDYVLAQAGLRINSKDEESTLRTSLKHLMYLRDTVYTAEVLIGQSPTIRDSELSKEIIAGFVKSIKELTNIGSNVTLNGGIQTAVTAFKNYVRKLSDLIGGSLNSNLVGPFQISPQDRLERTLDARDIGDWFYKNYHLESQNLADAFAQRGKDTGGQIIEIEPQFGKSNFVNYYTNGINTSIFGFGADLAAIQNTFDPQASVVGLYRWTDAKRDNDEESIGTKDVIIKNSILGAIVGGGVGAASGFLSSVSPESAFAEYHSLLPDDWTKPYRQSFYDSIQQKIKQENKKIIYVGHSAGNIFMSHLFRDIDYDHNKSFPWEDQSWKELRKSVGVMSLADPWALSHNNPENDYKLENNSNWSKYGRNDDLIFTTLPLDGKDGNHDLIGWYLPSKRNDYNHIGKIYQNSIQAYNDLRTKLS